jgi:drug/metabolite transporter (DMT)-like permease
MGMTYIGPFTFTAVRFYLGILPLLVVIGFLNRRKGVDIKLGRVARGTLIKGGIFSGIVLFFGISLQQFGIQFTSAGKAGFITTLYILLVPLLSLLIGKKVKWNLWISIWIGLIGLYLLTIKNDFSIQKGDLIVLCGAFFWALHILVIAHFAPKVDTLQLSLIQFFVAATLSLSVAFCIEHVEWAAIVKSAGPIGYAGIVSVGIAYTLQVVGQRHAHPTVVALILSLEAVFAVLAGMLFMHEQMSNKEVIGCGLMLLAVIFTELKPRN